MDAAAYLSTAGRQVDAEILTRLKGSNLPTELAGAMSHLLFPSGKRLRPALVLAACEGLGGTPSAASAAAAAVEFLHTYSLVHDDLPCMDDDPLRRGRPTVHVRYGEALAVLAGDALQALAFESLTAPVESWSAAAVADLAKAAGAANLVGGQVDDLAVERGAEAGASAELGDRIQSIHLRKTAALFAASTSIGARCAGAGEGVRSRMEGFGRDLGLAFQIADDCLDRDKDEPCTILRVWDESHAMGVAHQRIENALEALEGLGSKADPLRALARFAGNRDH